MIIERRKSWKKIQYAAWMSIQNRLPVNPNTREPPITFVRQGVKGPSTRIRKNIYLNQIAGTPVTSIKKSEFLSHLPGCKRERSAHNFMIWEFFEKCDALFKKLPKILSSQIGRIAYPLARYFALFDPLFTPYTGFGERICVPESS